MQNANSIRLRACRKRSGLDQAELGQLVGRNMHVLSRCERGLIIPDPQTMIAYELLFDIPVAKLLPDMTARVRRLTYERATQLLKRCNSLPREEVRTKVEFLYALCHKLEGRSV